VSRIALWKFYGYLNLLLVVKLLGGLFMQMMCAEDAAITPEVELAKLALVTSKDEEEDAAEQVVTAEPVETPVKTDAAPEPVITEKPDEVMEIQPTEQSGTTETQDETMQASPPSTIKDDMDEDMKPVTAGDDKAQDGDDGDSMVVEMGDDPPSVAEEVEAMPSRKKSTMVPDSGAMMFGE
jgi:ubiquitin carboxyl-terminal hydrolase 25/28